MWGFNETIRKTGRWVLLLIVALLTSCDAEELVTLGTLSIDEATSNAIHCRFEVIGDTPFDCGFCYATTKVGAESWTASKVPGTYELQGISGVIENLEPNTVYFVRGYAMTIRGRVYTETLSVKTTARAPLPGDNQYPDIDY